jgi:hypothetical protein
MSSPDDRDDPFRPRMGRRVRVDGARPRTFLAQMHRLARKHGRGSRTDLAARPKRAQIAVRPPHAQSRRCVIKARYVPLNVNGVKAARLHLAYLERDGVERDGAPGRLYGPDAGFTAEAFRVPLDGEKRQFRFIVSPEDGDRLDLAEFTRQLMTQVEKDTGRRLIWAAVNHHNTDNPHVHIVLRGVDRDGDDLRIDGAYLARGRRWRAQEIVTRELGRRSELDFTREQAVDVGRERLTEIDRVIDAHASAEGTVTIRSLLAAGAPEGRVCIARLQALETMELAAQTETGVWRLADGWKESLAALEERQQVIERLVPFVKQRAIAYRMVDPAKPVAAFEGTLVGKGLETSSRDRCSRRWSRRRAIPSTCGWHRKWQRSCARERSSGWVSTASRGRSPPTRSSRASRKKMAASTTRFVISGRSKPSSDRSRARRCQRRRSGSLRMSGGWNDSRAIGWPTAWRTDAGRCQRIWWHSSRRGNGRIRSIACGSNQSPCASGPISGGPWRSSSGWRS